MKAAREQLQALSRNARCAQARAEKTCVQLADLEAVLESSEEEILHAATILASLVPQGTPPQLLPSTEPGACPRPLLWETQFSHLQNSGRTVPPLPIQ